ncbi:MAG: shikimate kinase [Pirellulaceae bacterium]
MQIFLIGYRATGKSTVAQALAKSLRWHWVDTDVLIEETAGSSIKHIFSERGESGFRELEAKILEEVVQGDHRIVALGGGAVVRETNRQMLQDRGPVVWLTASVDAIVDRVRADAMSNSRRPALTSLGDREEVSRVLQQRLPIYQQCATLVVDTEGKSPDMIAEEILAALDLTAA